MCSAWVINKRKLRGTNIVLLLLPAMDPLSTFTRAPPSPPLNYLQQQEMLDVFGNTLDNLGFRPDFMSNTLRSSYLNDWYFFLHPGLFPLFCTEPSIVKD